MASALARELYNDVAKRRKELLRYLLSGRQLEDCEQSLIDLIMTAEIVAYNFEAASLQQAMGKQVNKAHKEDLGNSVEQLVKGMN